MLKPGVMLGVLILSASLCAAQSPAYAKVFIGTVDTFRDSQDSQYGLEWEFAEGLTRFDFKRTLGIMRTRDQSHYLYSGFTRSSKFSASATGLWFNFASETGVYLHGGGEDTDLGFWLEFKTSAGLLWQFADQTRMGLHFAHISNASIANTNPGTELIYVTYQLPF